MAVWDRVIRVEGRRYPAIRVVEEHPSAGAGGSQTSAALVREMVADQILVNLTEGATVDDLSAATGISFTLRRIIPGTGTAVLAFVVEDPAAVDRVHEAVGKLTHMVRFAEPDYIIRVAATPNDPRYADGSFWGMHNTGQTSGTVDADVDAPEGWDTRTSAISSAITQSRANRTSFGFGPNDLIIAVVDTGIRYTHEDLTANMWINPGESPGNGIDDDNNGVVDDVYGVNAVADNGDPMDDHYHGTHCAGTIAGIGNNGKGVAGASWQAKLVACKFLASDGSGANSDASEALWYAWEQAGADVISNSWGGGVESQEVTNQLRAAAANGAIIVVAAGNDSADLEANPTYPAASQVPNMITVSSSTRTDAASSFSNTNFGWSNIFAPGSDIVSCGAANDSEYRPLSGTSMATPMVAGIAALLRAQFPNETAAQIINRIYRGADTKLALNGKCQSGARVNLAGALASASGSPANDGFTSSITIPPSLPRSLRTQNSAATSEVSEPPHAGVPANKTIWYSWTAPASGNYVFSTRGSFRPTVVVGTGSTPDTYGTSTLDTVLAVYTGATVGTLTPVASNDDYADGSGTTNPWSRVTLTATSGTTYHIALGTKPSDDDEGLLILSISEPPANDNFSSAVTVGSIPYSEDRSNLNAGRESGEPKLARADVTDSNWLPADAPQNVRDSLASTFPDKRGQIDDGGASVWWTWTPTTTGEYTISTEGSTVDTLLGVHTGSAVTALTLVAQNDDVGLIRMGDNWVYLTSSRIRRVFTAGVTYRIQVDGLGGKEGAISLSIAPPPANDHIASATVMTGTRWSTIASNIGASFEQGEPKHADEYGGVSVWYEWTAPATQDFTIAAPVSTITTLLAVYETANPSAPDVKQLTEVASNTSPLFGSNVRLAAVAGRTYFIALDGAGGKQRNNIELFCTPANGVMLNDNFAERIAIAGTTSSLGSSTSGASFEPGEPDLFGSALQRSVWWTWTAPASGSVTMTTQFSEYNAAIGVYTGSALNALTQVVRHIPANGQGQSEFGTVTFTAARGTTYQIAVFGDASYCGSCALNLSMTPANGLPSVTAATLSASEVFTDQSVTVGSITTSDPESDPVTVGCQWQSSADGQTWSNIPGQTSATLPAGAVGAGVHIRCRLAPSDATGDGNPFFTSAVGVRARPVQAARIGQTYNLDGAQPLAAALPPSRRTVIINEFCKGAGTPTQTGALNGEWYELLVLQDQSMVGCWFSNVFRSIRFKDVPLWRSVPKGTLVVIYNPTNKHALLPADDVSTTDGNNRIIVSGSNADYFDDGGGFAPTCPKLSGSADTMSNNLNTGARIVLSRSFTGALDDISYHDVSVLGGDAQFRRSPHLPTWLPGGRAYRYTRDSEDACETSTSWELGNADANFATPGEPNTLAQSEWIAKLRAPAPAYRFGGSSVLPAGLSIDSATGAISGNLSGAAPGLYNLVIERYASGAATASNVVQVLVGTSGGVFRVPAGQTFNLTGNLDLDTATLVNRGTINANGYSLTQRQSYATWAAAHGIVGSATDPFSGLGIPNRLAFALNLDPATATAADLPSLGTTTVSGSRHLTLAFRRQTGSPRINYSVQATGNLSNPSGWTDLNLAAQMVGSPVTLDFATELVTVRDTVAAAGAASQRFLRLKVSDNLTPPSAPLSPSTTLGTANATITWAPSTGAESYTVKRATTSGGPYTVIASGLTETTYNDTSVATGTSYYYIVTAVNPADGESLASTEASITTPTSWAPAAPIGLLAAPNAMQVGLTWNAVANATSYTVRRSTTSGSGYTNLVTGVTGTSFNDTSALIGTTYYYVVTATNTGGTSAESSQASGAVVMPVGWWKMNDTTGLVATNSGSAGSAQNATLQNTSGVTWSAGKFGNAATLDGVGTSNTVSSYFRAANNLTASTVNACTITLWVKGNLSAAGWRGLFYDRSGSVQKGIHVNNGVLRIGNWENDNQTASTLTIPNNIWTFVALTVSPTQMKAWLRTESAGSFASWTSTMTSFTPRQWQRPAVGGDLWNANLVGQLDDVRYYDRTLTEAELSAIYANANL